ncbi:MAG: hypothetical protein IKV44_04670, partial [Clostridia bacterium]|nr:hypothetical protein [Clostridia bacterium]
GVESVIFPDGATVEFVGDAAFYNASTKFVYIGDCVTDDKLYKKPFDCAEYLEVVIIKNLTYIDQYCFCVAGATNAKTQIKVYCHSENISINNNAFVNRQNYGVEFYTIDPDIKSLNCNYTVYNGIAHPYTSKTITESTCVTQGTFGYATDCSCGNDYRTNTYVTYSNIDAELNELEHEAYGTDIGYLPLKEEHTVSDVVCNIDFVNGMTEMGIKCYKCLYCDEISTKEETASFPAIFKTIGYSYAEAEEVYGIMQSFGVNHKALSEYESVIGQKLSYGLAAGSVNKLGENADLVKADGTAYEGAICASYVDKAFDLIEMKISGLTEAHKGTELYICAYYVVNGKVYYISGGVSNLEKPTTISYDKIANA